MNPLRTLILSLLLATSFISAAQKVTDTLHTPYGDRVIVTYELVQKKDKVEVRFKEERKKLGTTNGHICKDLAEVKVMFFDRIGFSDVTFKGLPPSVFMIPPGIKYEKSSDGFLDLDDKPTLVFEGKSPDTSVDFNIPMYLVHYEKKHRYNIFAQCNDLIVKAAPAVLTQDPGGITGDVSSQIQMLPEESLSDDDIEALASLQYIAEELTKIDKLPFSDMMIQKAENLKILKYKVQNEEIVSKIDEVLKEFESKKAILEEQAAIEAKKMQEAETRKMDSTAFVQCTTVADCEAYLKEHPNGAFRSEVEELKTSLEVEAEEQASKEKRNKIWMIIGGVLLAILLFVGNQVMQSFRNMKMQRNMMQMQQNAASQAENMAKRKVQGEIRKQTGKVKGQVKQKGKDIVRKGTKGIKPGKNNGNNNRVSI